MYTGFDASTGAIPLALGLLLKNIPLDAPEVGRCN